MTSILAKFPLRGKKWLPQTPEEFYALRLARALGDVENLGYYVRLANSYELSLLTDSVKRAARAAGGTSHLRERFLIEFRNSTGVSDVR